MLVPTKWHYSQQADCSVSIYLTSVDQFHTEIVLPVQAPGFDWRQHLNLAQLGSSPFSYRFISFGWGDRRFFIHPAYDPISIFDALLMPSAATLHIWGHSQSPPRFSAAFEVKELHLSRRDYLKLARFVNGSILRDATGKSHYIQAGFYPYSAFFEAKGNFSILRTCNIWTADALKQVHINTPMWAALAPAILPQAKGNCPSRRIQ
ncbi:MAG TPA: DUF2459 domain-containing protein [Stenomitos sp.]